MFPTKKGYTFNDVNIYKHKLFAFMRVVNMLFLRFLPLSIVIPFAHHNFYKIHIDISCKM